MKKRNGIVLALCAIVGAASFYACSDDSGKKTDIDNPGTDEVKLVANPNDVTLNHDQQITINLSGAASKIVNVANNLSTCVESVQSVQLDANGKGTLIVHAIDDDCTGRLDLSDGSSSTIITYKVAASDSPVLNVSATSLEIARKSSETFKATYTLNGEGQSGVLKVSTSDMSCAAPEISEYNIINGEAEIKVSAEGSGCNATITVSLKDNPSVSKTVNVSVPAAPDSKLIFVDNAGADLEELEVAYAAGEGRVRLSYVDGDGEPIGSAKIALSLDGDSCLSISEKNIFTGADGFATGKVNVVGSNCDAILTATAGNISDSLKIHVNEQTEYLVTIRADYKSNKYETINRVMLFYSNEACDMDALASSAQNYKSGAEMGKNQSDGALVGVPDTLASFTIPDMSVTVKSVIVSAKAEEGDRDPVTAYGCKDISVNDQNSTVVVDLVGVPVDIKGTYDVVSNFDLTSGFTKPSASEYNINSTTLQFLMPRVEYMSAGAWVQFVVDFCKDPVGALLAFIWSNTLDRLATIDGMPEWLKTFIAGEGTKSLALGTLQPIIEKYLGENTAWFNILRTITPDVADLTTNMQLTGTFQIDNVSGNIISNVDETFKNVEYQWSYNPTGCLSTDHYVDPSKCRLNLALGDNAITGKWNGSVDYNGTTGNDGLLDIDKHGVSFKWASILFTTVFGAILPKALGYEVVESNDGTPLYIKSFLNGVVFTPLTNYYVSEYQGKEKPDSEGNTITYPTLKQQEICNRGIEAIVYWIYPKADGNDFVKTGIALVTQYACGDSGVGQLDTLVFTALDKIQASSDNTFKLYSNDCALHDGGTLKYQQFGNPDTIIYTANEIVNQSKATKRCQWDIDVVLKKDVKDSEGHVTGQTEEHVDVKGFFHATRQN